MAYNRPFSLYWQEFIKEHLAGDTGNSEPGPSCLELKKSIKQSNGIIGDIADGLMTHLHIS